MEWLVVFFSALSLLGTVAIMFVSGKQTEAVRELAQAVKDQADAIVTLGEIMTKVMEGHHGWIHFKDDGGIELFMRAKGEGEGKTKH